ncbi:hypothetical protein ABH930_006380 [Kitasatospora sp. GAS204A]|uniref:hypothetical protein n=1 Tax=unclassified Kitasatospora TaxID=2633591 RepID=UPI0024732216|nr:hypothetical protein [Kitasatospora sp. GAS204B]MDH6122028.1 hypothetical protein [Kitasatospora sp. GAS204B]
MTTPPQPQQPSWGQQSPPPASRQKPKRGKAGCLGCAGVLALVVVIGIAANAGSKKTSAPAAKSAPAKQEAPAVPSPAAPTSAAPNSQAAAAPSLPPLTLPPTQLAPAGNRQKAASILTANDAYYQQEFDSGVTVILARGQDGSFDAFHAWQQKASKDIQPGTDAFKQADAEFDASDEPSSISDWRDDNTVVQSDLFSLANDGLDVGGPDDAQARQKIQADIAQMKTDMATADGEATQVGAGK